MIRGRPGTEMTSWATSAPFGDGRADRAGVDHLRAEAIMGEGGHQQADVFGRDQPDR